MNRINRLFIEHCTAYGQLEEVKRLLQHPDIDLYFYEEDDSDLATGFMIACARDNMEVVEYILENTKIDVNFKAEYGHSAFSLAVQCSAINAIKRLLQIPHLIVDKNHLISSISPFEKACSDGLTEIVQLFLADPRFDVKQEGSAFYKACENGKHKVVKLLLADERVNVNDISDATNNFLETPLGRATMNQRAKVVKLLVADARVKCIDPYYTLVASLGGKYFLDAYGSYYPAFFTDETRTKTFKAILTLNPPVNPPNDNEREYTPLSEACYARLTDIVVTLLSLGADPSLMLPEEQEEYAGMIEEARVRLMEDVKVAI